MLADGAFAYVEHYGRGLKPDPDLLIDEWSEEYARIPRGAGAEYGKYRVDRTPYAAEVMRCLSPGHPSRRVVAKVASQLFKTQVAINWIGASIHLAAANILVLEPTDKIAKRVSSRIDKTIADIPVIRERVAQRRSRDSRNTMDTKEFDGGTLYVTTAGSAANLAEVPIRYIYGDEIDRWDADVDNEGSPIDLAETRASTFGRNAKIYYTSSPTEEGASAIDDLYRQSDQREYMVPCPMCGDRQLLVWEQMRWANDLSDVWYECSNCNGKIKEHQKPSMLAAGAWTSTAKGDGETVGFSLNAIYSPLGWASWTQLARQFEKASAALERGDMEPMQVFYNTRLALTWDVVRERVKGEQISALAEPFSLGTVPKGALVLTAAVDCQGNRLEVLVLGWGPGMERWTVAQHVIMGDPTDVGTWNALDELLLTPIDNANGVPMIIQSVAVDSGSWTQDVYDYCRNRKRRGIRGEIQEVLAIKGESRHGRAIIQSRPRLVDVNHRGRVVKQGVELWLIGTDTAKDWVYPRLLSTTGEGSIHYSSDLSDEWFNQLVAEVKRTKYVRGYKRAEWHQLKGQRNEALDLMVYNLAMAYHLELHKRPTSYWDRRVARCCPPKISDSSVTAEAVKDDQDRRKKQVKRQAKPPRRPRSNYATGWKP